MIHNSLGIAAPEILIPDEKLNLKKWAVLACDQYTTDSRYWSEVEHQVGSSPSTLHIVLPEIYLGQPDTAERISYAKETMGKYLEDGVLKLLPKGFVLVEREIGGKPRKGLMVAVDLEEYDYDISKRPLIRATEQTLLERIPPRVEIRKGAVLEVPHALLLMDDRNNQVIEPIWERRSSLPKLYDFELMQGGGRIRGYFVNDKALTQQIFDAMQALPTWEGMRFAVGDGNHSLATAKAVWDAQKERMSPEEREESPLRYALVELINLYDEALTFQPIHRVLIKLNPVHCIQYVVDKLNSKGRGARLVFSRKKQSAQVSDAAQTVFFTSKDSAGRIEITQPEHPLAVGELQPILEQYVAENPSVTLEYIHGDAEMEEIATEYDNLGFYMPGMKKEDFFSTIVECGVLPKKSFSLGSADEKRYYMECRLLVRAPEEEVPLEQEKAAEKETNDLQ